MEPKPDTVLSGGFDQVLTEHLAQIRAAIIARAEELAEEERGEDSPMKPAIRPIHYLKAIDELAPGREFDPAALKQSGLWHRFLDSVSPITLIASLLTIVFAAFGLWAVSSDPKGINGAAYLDIAKIFAGAIVGSASVAASSTIRRPVSANPPLQRTRDKAARR
jgi:hypothetical protein